MIIKANTELKNLKGEVLKNEDGVLNLGIALSNILISSKAGGKMKMFVLAQKLFKDDTVEVDQSDFNMIKESVKTSEIYSNLVLGQCELILESIKDEDK